MNRGRLFQRIGGARLAGIALRLKAHMRPMWLTALAYHRVCEDDANSPWDTNLISATPEQFRRQLQFIKRYFSPITSQDIVAWSKGQFSMPPNSLVITFDDGYRDNHDVALPLLQEAGVRADFFVCPWHIENRRLFWWDRITFCLKRSAVSKIEMDYPERLELDVGTVQNIEAARLTLVRMVKRRAEVGLGALLLELERASGAKLEERREAERLVLSWADVRALRQAGMGVGSHSYSHPVLALQDADVVRREMEQSKAVLEAQLGEQVTAIAYPVGSFTDGTKAMAHDAGYELGYSYCSGASFLRSADLLELKRVAIEKDMTFGHFKAVTALPFWAH